MMIVGIQEEARRKSKEQREQETRRRDEKGERSRR